MQPDSFDNLIIAISAVVGIYFHIRILFTQEVRSIRRIIGVLAVISLGISFTANTLSVFPLISRAELQGIYTVSNWMTIPTIMSLAMSDYGYIKLMNFNMDKFIG